MSTTRPDRRPGGFAIVSAIFILVVLAALAGFIVSVTTTQSLTFAQDIQGARAYQAARAGTEWGIYQWLSATPSTSCPSTPDVTLTFSDPDLQGFQAVVHRDRNPAAGGINFFCTITATATPTGTTTAGSLGFVERQIQVVVEGN
jgi:MSHA biogenesis protein MshP